MKQFAGKRISRKIGFAVGANIDFKTPLVVFDIDATLVLDDSSAIGPTVNMLHKICKTCRVFLITARHPSMLEETIQELKSIGITPDMYESLMLSPPEDRKDMHRVGLWKERMRKKIAIHAQAPISLTIGDQWTDIIAVQSEDEMLELDSGFLGWGKCAKYALVRPHDGISAFGLKLEYRV
jgi:predicted secreted acid phosphatase